ncbi:YdeI/OmpD-associated family protein [bacterium]|nr:YdeI/OmpD-associated family protein [bacterium]HPF34837.1 YdeI/OmpD-associated family protein [Candidatus Krumholzibacteria bacterium]HRX51430.1 YdeI/OmpD-associated family protein [Candidatus Krumholzibacteria bacterium]
MSPRARYFKSPKEFGDWLAEHGATAEELLVGFWKKHTGRPSLTWPQSVDEALCHGWIDSIRRRVDDDRYTIRFTPRRAGSNWSGVNMARMEELLAEGRVTEAGKAAWRRREPERSKVYSYEQDGEPELEPDHRAALDADAVAGRFFATLPPGHRRTVLGWIATAKRQETRDRRFAQFLEACAEERRLF